jgi:hypothetical protein
MFPKTNPAGPSALSVFLLLPNLLASFMTFLQLTEYGDAIRAMEARCHQGLFDGT